MENKVALSIGNHHSDERGTVSFNNAFDASEIKRIYFIENKNTAIIRAWQGHKIEKRWFSAVQGSFIIKLIKIDNWDSPSNNLIPEIFTLDATDLKILYVPQGYATSIQALEEKSKLMVMVNFLIGETKDEYRFNSDYFDQKN